MFEYSMSKKDLKQGISNVNDEAYTKEILGFVKVKAQPPLFPLPL